MPLTSSLAARICGLNGCLTMLIGSEALRNRAKERVGRDQSRTPTIADIIKGALEGDPVSRSIVEDVGHYLGIAVAGLLNLMNPAVVRVKKVASVGDSLSMGRP